MARISTEREMVRERIAWAIFKATGEKTLTTTMDAIMDAVPPTAAPELLGCVFDDDNIQRDDDLAPDDFSDIDAVAFCLSYKGDVSDLGAKDHKHLYGCAIATLVACMGYGDGSPDAHQLAWDFLNGQEGGDDE